MYKKKLLMQIIQNAPLPPPPQGDPGGPLFGVPFPDYEKLRLKLEKIYYQLIMKEYEKALKNRAFDAFERLKSGFEIGGEQLDAIQRDIFQNAVNDACYEISLQRSIEAARAGAEKAEKDINKTISKEQAAALRSASPEERSSILAEFAGAKVTLPPLPEWKNDPDIIRIVSGNANRETDFYSRIFFHTNESETLLENIRANIEAGKGVNDILDAAAAEIKKAGEVDYHVKNVVRTETTRAIESGRQITAKKSKYCKAFQFYAVHDYRTTIYCAERHRLLIDIEDETNIRRCTPPLHYQCRSTLAELSRRQLEAAGGYEQIEADKIKLDNAPDFEW